MELEEFLGKKYRMVQSEYFDDFLREVGMNWTLRQIAKKVTPTIELKKDGDNYLIQNYNPLKNSSSLVGTRPDVEYEYETPDGRMVRSSFKIEKTKIFEIQNDQKGRTVYYERTFSPTEFSLTNKNSEVEGEGDVQTFKKLDQENNRNDEPITKSPSSKEEGVKKVKISSKMVSKSQMKEFREAFRLFDRDGDGSITKEELGRVMRSLGQFARTEELQQMLQEVDIDGDGNVSFEEFIDIAWSAGAGSDPDHVPTREEEEKELRDAFRVFDKHNRGYITASDLRAVIQCLGEDLSEEEIEDMIKEVDVDGDGRIDFYEFVNAMGEPGDDDSFEEDEDEYTGF